MKDVSVQRNYKDTLFRMLFKEKERLLSLYNGLNGTAYTDAEKLEITTLENAIYMNYKNDVSFVLGHELMLYEHQSTVNPNMPLRSLIYVAQVLQGRVKDERLYGKELVRLPVPKFVVFYNGVEFQPEKQKLRLSDAFEERQEEPELELTVTVYNINPGNNKELMEACRPLKEYAQYVEMVRKYAEKLHFREAVEKAVDECIKKGILRDFLIKNRAEAIEMCIFEFDEEKYLEMEREYAYRDGLREGKEEGKAEGEGKLLRLQKFLIDTGRSGELGLVITDQAYREQLYQTLIEGQCTQ